MAKYTHKLSECYFHCICTDILCTYSILMVKYFSLGVELVPLLTLGWQWLANVSVSQCVNKGTPCS
jgi:hypothetical protein